MKLYKTTITPLSTFATSLQGDTVFGQLCWVIRYVFGKDRLEELLSSYDKEPFMVVSDAFAKGYLPKPHMPSHLLNENSDEKKQNRKKIWLKVDELQNGEFQKAKTSKDIDYTISQEAVIKNSINYKSFHTGDGFDPFSEDEIAISDSDIYILLDEERFSLKELNQAFKFLSQWGYGKNTTIGKGRFEFDSFEEFKLDKNSSTTFMGLSSASLQNLKLKDAFYNPITKFGKHGGELSTKSAFKKPLLLAKSGFVVVYEEKQELQYIGQTIKGHSNHSETVHQGYSIVVPIMELNL